MCNVHARHVPAPNAVLLTVLQWRTHVSCAEHRAPWGSHPHSRPRHPVRDIPCFLLPATCWWLLAVSYCLLPAGRLLLAAAVGCWGTCWLLTAS